MTATPAPKGGMWQADPPAKPARKRHVPKPAAGQQLTITPPKRPQPKAKPEGAVKGMATARRIVAPTPVDGRFTVLPGEELTGGFSAGRLGIDPLTGLPWERRA